VQCGLQAVRLAPRDADAHYNLGLALSDTGSFQKASEQYRAALSCNPNHGLAANNLGTALEKMGDDKGAEECYTRATRINARHAEAQNNLGALLSARGELDRARACFEAAIAADPSFVHAHYNLSTLKKYVPGDLHLKALEEISRKSADLAPAVRLRFCFAIAKAYEDVGRYDESFAAYAEGNLLKRATFQYDEAKFAQGIARVRSHYDAAFAAKPAKGCDDETPVFIVGMPRSGTTLLEQIISSHSAVHGAGELHDLGQAISDVMGANPEGDYMEWLPQAGADKLQAIGQAYVDRLKARDPGALRITDKMPGNFYYIGLIRKILPKAKIIHSLRDPVDTCFSNYSRLFSETMPFAYDLGELGRYYRRYRALMEHWHAVLPGSVLDVKYEDLVRDQEKQSRRLIEYCGLPWEEACLDFHRNERPVKTASIAQVRKPIYTTSVARCERFGKHLDPLRAALDDKGEIS
jgi:tetratricopeptide (TPR) repeat protein